MSVSQVLEQCPQCGATGGAAFGSRTEIESGDRLLGKDLIRGLRPIALRPQPNPESTDTVEFHHFGGNQMLPHDGDEVVDGAFDVTCRERRILRDFFCQLGSGYDSHADDGRMVELLAFLRCLARLFYLVD